MTSPILWQNDEKTITLLDIPRSISAAQGTPNSPCNDILISSKPLEQPFPSQEPKTEKAKANLKDNTISEQLSAEYQTILQDALHEVRKTHDQDWCLPRHTTTRGSQSSGKKRKLDQLSSPQDLESKSIHERSSNQQHHSQFPSPSPGVSERSNIPLTCEVCFNGDDRFQSNCRSSTTQGQISATKSKSIDATEGFRFPPRSSLYLGNLQDTSRAFHAAVRSQANSHDTRKQFDFVLLDPPWPNRSVKRATKANRGRGYSIADSLEDVQQLILGTDLDMLMAGECLLGVWVTNRQTFRELVLGDDGIFSQWGVELEEEWIWLKTTTRGEPVSSIDSLWRKPYEVLLLGRKRGSDALGIPSAPRRRVMVAVPDLHSRKPCLKELIEPMIVQKDDYRALEVFARHLVAGWVSWGNECIKFNGETNWYTPEDPKPSKEHRG